MRRGTVMAVAAAAALGMGAAPARADSLGLRIADWLGVNTLRLPWTVHARLSGFGDPSKPMCVGVQVSPLWGNGSDYTGRCRYGAPLGAMRAAISSMDRRVAVGTAREDGLAAN